MRLPDPGAACWWNGRKVRVEEVSIPLGDPAAQSGLGLFETIAVRDGRPMELGAHLERLREGAASIGLEPPDMELLRRTILDAAGELPGARWVKVMLTGGGERIVYSGGMDAAERGRSVSAVLLPWRRNPQDPLSTLKTLAYGANVIGARWAVEHGADEGIWLNTRGHLAEGCTSNLFVIQGRKLFTAAERDGVLPGVIRGLVLDAARRLGLAVHEGKVRLKRLERADEAFLTSSVRGIRPLVEFERKPVGRGEAGPWTRKIAARVEAERTRRWEQEAADPAEKSNV